MKLLLMFPYLFPILVKMHQTTLSQVRTKTSQDRFMRSWSIFPRALGVSVQQVNKPEEVHEGLCSEEELWNCSLRVSSVRALHNRWTLVTFDLCSLQVLVRGTTWTGLASCRAAPSSSSWLWPLLTCWGSDEGHDNQWARLWELNTKSRLEVLDQEHKSTSGTGGTWRVLIVFVSFLFLFSSVLFCLHFSGSCLAAKSVLCRCSGSEPRQSENRKEKRSETWFDDGTESVSPQIVLYMNEKKKQITCKCW